MRPFMFLSVVAAALLAFAATPSTRPLLPAPNATGNHAKRNALGTPAPLGAPTLANVESQVAPMIAPGPATVYLEILPAYPIAQAADPYSQPSDLINRRFSTPPPAASHLAMRPHGPRFALPQVVSANGVSLTGINPWWSFASGQINGAASYGVNIATGNLVVRGSDVVVPHRGVSFGFARTYNSFSQHDWNNTDQGGVNNYGDGWTNSFDMHIAQNSLSSGNGISVFDQSGARYDYAKSCSPTCVYTISAPLGQYSVLTFDHNTGWFYWTNKAGVVFMFHNVTDNAGVAGRLAKIWFRNNNVQLAFTYAFDQGASPAPSTLNEITAQTDATNGTTQKVVLQFSNVQVATGVRRLLSSLTWPDGATNVNFKYDTSGRLIEVDEPTNSTQYASLPQTFQYSSGTYQLAQVAGGRWNENGASPAPSPGPRGGYVQFNYTGLTVNTVQSYGYINPKITDDSGTSAVQTGISNAYGISTPYRQTYFAYSNVSPAPNPSPAQSPTGSAACSSTGSTPVYDSDGHDTVFCWDASNRVVQSSSWTGSIWVVEQQVWDSNNDRVSIIDARGKRTDAAFDVLGNLIASALPAPSPGLPRPTTLITHDASNNVLAVCDPVWADSHGFDWTATPSPTYSPCPATNNNSQSHPGPSLYAYTNPSPEPFGEMVSMTRPMGYVTSISYAIANQGGTLDYGQPTQIVGAQVSQSNSNPSITPTEQRYYNDFGELICDRIQVGTDSNQVWATWINIFTTSDANDGRVSESADPDDSTLNNNNGNVACPKTPGIANSQITTTYSYFANGQVASQLSPLEQPSGLAEQFAYDADGDQITDTVHYGSAQTAGTTSRYYDADGRLIEVVKPGGWDTRYFYDLSQNGSNSNPVTLTDPPAFFGGTHGELFKLQEFEAGAWVDLKGADYDFLDRAKHVYTYQPNANCSSANYATCETASATSNVYDSTSATTGLLSTMTDAIGTTTTYTYDNIGRTASTAYSDGTTPGRATSYDLDGRVTGLNSTGANGIGLESYQYDGDGNEVSVTEPSGANSDQTIITYGYYLNDLRESISAAPVGNPAPGNMNQTNLLVFDYFADSRPMNETLNYVQPSPSPSPVAEEFQTTYTAAGRVTSRLDPFSTTTLSYEAAGRLKTLGAPEGTTTYSTWDPEGQVLSFTEPVRAGATVTQDYDTNGELTQQTYIDPNSQCYPEPAGFWQNGADGFMVAKSFQLVSGSCREQNITGSEDVRNAVSIALQIPCEYDGFQEQCTEPETFDADGRMVSVPTKQYNENSNNFQDTQWFYDAENHFVKQEDYQNNVDMKRTYGPDGHPVQIGTADFNHAIHWETIHWDGDRVLFTTNATGQVDDIKVGALADYLPLQSASFQLAVWDRDSTGKVRAPHGAWGNYGWAGVDSYSSGGSTTISLSGNWGTNLPLGQGGGLFQGTIDGYQDGLVVIQGARDYCPSTRGWVERDPSTGEDLNPMTQKSYTWNNNNPSSFSDPSGSVAIGQDDGTGGEGGGPEWVDAGYYGGDDNGDPTGENLSSIAAFFAAEKAAQAAEDAAFQDFAAATSYRATYTVSAADAQLGRVTSTAAAPVSGPSAPVIKKVNNLFYTGWTAYDPVVGDDRIFVQVGTDRTFVFYPEPYFTETIHSYKLMEYLVPSDGPPQKYPLGVIILDVRLDESALDAAMNLIEHF